MTLQKVVLHPKSTTHTAHFVFEKGTDRLYEFELHTLGEPSHVVVALDDHTRNVDRLNNVGVYSPLSEPFHIFYFGSFGFKYIDEALADDFSLLLRVGYSG